MHEMRHDKFLFILISSIFMSVLVVCQDFPMCNDLSTPHIPPEGVLSQAGYGALCEKTPCLPGMSCCYNGKYKAVCEDVNECLYQELNICAQTCINLYGNYTCACDKLGYRLKSDGRSCEQAPGSGQLSSDDCDITTCSGTGRCIEVISGDILCVCEPGWRGDNCSQNIDDCSTGETTKCANGGTCVDLVDGFSCTCTAEWTGARCAEDIPECDADSCSGNGDCVERVGGGVVCICEDRWSGDNCSVDTVDDCQSAPCNNGATCTDGYNSFTCECAVPWTGNTCESLICGGDLKNNSITNSSLCLVQSIVSWDEAKAICESAAGYRLASLPSVEAVQFVESISLDPQNNADWGQDDKWIGLKPEAGTWRWWGWTETPVSTEDPIWNDVTSAPEKSDGTTCGSLTVQAGDQWRGVHDNSCDNGMHFICEKMNN